MRRASFVAASFAVAAACLVAATSGTARAQAPAAGEAKPAPDDVARADKLFKDAQAQLDAGNVAKACPLFAESLKLAPGIGVSLYLADCYERAGLRARAYRQFKAAQVMATAKGDGRSLIAGQRAQKLEAGLPRLTIAVAPATKLPDLAIRIDGWDVPEPEWNVAMPTDPGTHVVVASASAHKSLQHDVTVLNAAQATQTLTIEPLEPEGGAAAGGAVAVGAAGSTPGATNGGPPPGAAVPPGASPVTPENGNAPPADQAHAGGDAGSTRRYVGVGVGAAGVVVTGLGVVFGLMAKSKLDDSNADGHCTPDNACDAAGLGLRSDADANATRSNVAIGVGVVAIVAGVVIYLTAPHAKQTASATANGLAVHF